MQNRKAFIFKALLTVIIVVVAFMPFIIPFKYSLPPSADLKIYVYTGNGFPELTAAQIEDLYEDLNLLKVRRRFPILNFNSSYLNRDVTELGISSNHAFHTKLYIFSNGTPAFFEENGGMQFVPLEEDRLQQIRRKVRSYQNS